VGTLSLTRATHECFKDKYRTHYKGLYKRPVYFAIVLSLTYLLTYPFSCGLLVNTLNWYPAHPDWIDDVLNVLGYKGRLAANSSMPIAHNDTKLDVKCLIHPLTYNVLITK